jgi:aryl-alcohol dehydrogenase-like predicted oxidoreductase
MGAQRIGLGTAQFGLDYGISNAGGCTPPAEVRAILSEALRRGVRVLDTAPAYGAAEALLGDLAPGGTPFEVVTKVPGGAEPRASLEVSLARLRRASVAGLLAHDPEDLLGPGGEAFFAALDALRAEGLAAHVGASVQRPEQAEVLLERFPIGLLQLPLNVLDQRALASDLLPRARERGILLHARSVFLQGLLLMEPEDVPAGLGRARPALAAFRARAAQLGCTPLQAAVGFVAAQPGVDVVLCGVSTAAQLGELLAEAPALDPLACADLALSDLDILEPPRWPR